MKINRTRLLLVCMLTVASLFGRLSIASATIALVNLATGIESPGKAFTIGVPTGTSAGDLMVAEIAISSGSARIPTPPSGWTTFSSLHRPLAPFLSEWIWYRVAGSSEPVSYAWTAPQAYRWAGGIISYRGVNTSATLPFDGSSEASGVRGTSLTAPSFMTADAGDQLLAFFSGTGNNYSTAPLGMNHQWTVDSGPLASDVDAWFFDQSLAGSGATGTETANQILGKPWQAVMLALLPNTDAPYFSTSAYGASLPSDSTCANEIASTPETIPANVTMNSLTPTSAELSAYQSSPLSFENLNGNMTDSTELAQVDGSFAGPGISTDMIFRWSACKHGIDENVVRATAWQESSWLQQGVGDHQTAESRCVNGSFSALWDTIITEPNGFQVNTTRPRGCYQSWSAFQTKVFYEYMTWPEIMESTAFGADYNQATTRECMNGAYQSYFGGSGSTYWSDFNAYASNPNAVSTNPLNTSGETTTNWMLFGCVGFHYSGDWYDKRDAIPYIAQVQQILATQPWLQ